MYMFDNDRHNNRPIVAPFVPPIQIKPVHSSVSYQWAIYQKSIGVVMNRLVGMGLYTRMGLLLVFVSQNYSLTAVSLTYLSLVSVSYSRKDLPDSAFGVW